MVKLADTLDLGSSSRECRFKSCYPHQKSKLFSPACEHVLGAHGAPAELRRRKEFFLIFAELKLRCGNVVYMKRRVWFLIVTKPLLPAFGQVGEKNPFFRRTNKSSDRKRSCGTTAGEGIFSLNKAAPVVGAGILTSDLHLLSACVLGAKDSRGSKLPQALAEDLFRERELLRHFGGRKEFFRFIRRHWKLEREL